MQYYFRYADDFLFLHNSPAHLQVARDKVDWFLQKCLRLAIHPDKIILLTLQRGIDFVGYVELPHYRALRTSTKHRMFAKMKQKVLSYNGGKLNEEKLEKTTQSYLGLLKHCHGYNLQIKLLNTVWLNKVALS